LASKVFGGLSTHRDMKITDLLGCSGSVIFFLLASAWVPLIGPFFSLLIPLPFLYYSSKLGLKQGLKTSFITLFIIGLIGKLAGYQHIVIFCLEFGLLGLIISEIYRRELSFVLTIFWGTLLMLFVGAIFLFIIGLSRKMGPLELIIDYFQTNLMQAFAIYENTGLDQGKVAQLQQYGKLLSDLITKVYPSLIIVGTGFVVWLNVVVSKPLFRLRNVKYPDFGQLHMWQAPEIMVWGVIAAGFALFFPVTGIKLISINSLIVMSVIYVFSGLSIVMFFLNRYNIPSWARVGIYALIIIQQMFLLLLALAGLFDQWIDFRKIHKRKQAE